MNPRSAQSRIPAQPRISAQPRIVARPELLDGTPLPLLKTRRVWLWLLFALVPVTFIAGLVIGGDNWTMGLAVLAVWLLCYAVSWADRRAFMRATDDLLEVRNVRALHEVLGADVRRVVHQYNGRRPDFQLITTHGKVWVPASQLERGHSTLFTWLDMHAPQAELDAKSQYWHDLLLNDGRI